MGVGASSLKPLKGRQKVCQVNCWFKRTSQERSEWIKSFLCGEGHDVGRREELVILDTPIAANPPAPVWPPADTASLGMISEELLYFLSSL